MADLNVYITSELTSSERRVSLQWTLEYFRRKMELITGIPPDAQRAWCYKRRESSDRFELALDKPAEYTYLSEFAIPEFTRIHIEDTRPDSELKELAEDDAEIHFKMGDEDYDRRPNTVRKWKKELGLGRFDPQWEQKRKQVIEANNAVASKIRVGDRCRLSNSELERRGTVRYVGMVPEIDNDMQWVGVELDEPYGKNDGSIKEHRYFQCSPNYGSFVKPVNVEVGDFPEEDLDDEL